MTNFHIAQVNIASMLQPLDDPSMQGFVEALAPINALAESSPGFVWRLTTPAGDASTLRVFPDPRIIINMTVWDSIESLWDFVYKAQHTPVMGQRGKWFERMKSSHMAMWWVEAGTIPSLEDAKERLEHIDLHGPTAYAFTFKQRFPAGQAQPVTTIG
jgi:hypothetical protein